MIIRVLFLNIIDKILSYFNDMFRAQPDTGFGLAALIAGGKSGSDPVKDRSSISLQNSALHDLNRQPLERSRSTTFPFLHFLVSVGQLFLGQRFHRQDLS